MGIKSYTKLIHNDDNTFGTFERYNANGRTSFKYLYLKSHEKEAFTYRDSKMPQPKQTQFRLEFLPMLVKMAEKLKKEQPPQLEFTKANLFDMRT